MASHELPIASRVRSIPGLPGAVQGAEAYLFDQGYAGLFLHREYTYVNIGAYRYWIVEGVVNRASLETPGVEEVRD